MLRTVGRIVVILTVFSFVLAGCTFGSKPGEEMYDHLEKAAGIEQGFVDYQKKLIQKEKKEQELYGKIIKLSMKEYDQIVSLSKQAADLADQRKQLIQKEKEVLDKAYEEFVKVKPLAKKIKDEKLAQKANALIETMNKRHETYGKLYESYISSIELDQELYQMLQKKDLKPGDLQKQIDKINNKYEEVNQAKEKFNQYTEQYNEAKKAFYKAADLDVTIQNEG
ncbi:MAG TPA: YkyA family protein [Bacillales bacterium]|nr:YkyA family protein [Bacillales bacterium]